MDPTEHEELCIFLDKQTLPNRLIGKGLKTKRQNFRRKASKYTVNISDKCLLYDGRKVIVGIEACKQVFREVHASAMGGHSGINKTHEAITRRYYWPSMTTDIRTWIKQCDKCQRNNPLRPVVKELHPIKISEPWEMIGIDLMGPWKETKFGYKYLFTATDYFTKWVEAFPIREKSAIEVAQSILKLFFRHGATKSILHDNGKEFVNKVNEELCKLWEVEVRCTAAYHPETNGLDERTNQTIKRTIQKMVNEKQDNWDEFIDSTLFAIRSKKQMTTKYTPFYLMFNREPKFPSQIKLECAVVPDLPIDLSENERALLIETRSENIKKVHETVLKNIDKQQEKQKQQFANKKGMTSAISVGMLVLKYNRRKKSRKGDRLQPEYSGPYEVIDIFKGKVTLRNHITEQLLKRNCSIKDLKIYHSDNESKELHEQMDPNESRITQEKEDISSLVNTANEEQWKEEENSTILLEKHAPKISSASKDCTTEKNLKESRLSVGQIDRNIAFNLVESLWALKKDFHIPVAKIESTVITDTDIRSLRKTEWLTDKVLDSFLLLLVTTQNDLGHNVQHYVQSKMTSIINREFKNMNMKKSIHKLSECETVIGTYHRSGHWTLIVAEMKVGKLYFYNPAGEQHIEMQKVLHSWRQYITQYSKRYSEELVSNWTIETVPHATQTDSYNCGVYCLMFAEKHLCGNISSLTNISSEDLIAMRKRVAQELMLYEVFLTGCCPKCGFVIEDDQAIECVRCKRSYHFKSFCIEDDLMDFGNSSKFTCRLCRINFWPVAACKVTEVKDNKVNTIPHSYSLRKDPTKKRRKSHWYELDEKRKGLFSKGIPCMKSAADSESLPKTTSANCKDSNFKATTEDLILGVEIKGISEQFYCKHLNMIIQRLYNMMECTDETCDEADHYRHHEFVRAPLEVYNRERFTHNFGINLIFFKVCEKIEESLMKQLLTSTYKDPKHPYTSGRVRLIKNLTNIHLQEIFFKHGLLADSYVRCVCVKEALIWLVCQKELCPYEYANERCQTTEISISNIVRGIRRQKCTKS